MSDPFWIPAYAGMTTKEGAGMTTKEGAGMTEKEGTVTDGRYGSCAITSDCPV